MSLRRWTRTLQRRFRRRRRRYRQVTSIRRLFLFRLRLERRSLRLGRGRLGRRAPQAWGRDWHRRPSPSSRNQNGCLDQCGPGEVPVTKSRQQSADDDGGTSSWAWERARAWTRARAQDGNGILAVWQAPEGFAASPRVLWPAPEGFLWHDMQRVGPAFRRRLCFVYLGSTFRRRSLHVPWHDPLEQHACVM